MALTGENKCVLLPTLIWLVGYLRCHVLTDGFDLHFDISDQQVELILYELQSVHLILSVLQCRHSKAPAPTTESQFTVR